MQRRAAVPASTSSPVRSEVIEAEPNQVACAAAIVDSPGRRAYTTVSRSGPKTDGFTDQLQRCAEPEAIDHSHLMLRFEHARWTHYREGLIPYRLLGKRTQGSFTGASTPESGPLIKPVVSAGVRKTVLPDSSGLPDEIAPDRVERA